MPLAPRNIEVKQRGGFPTRHVRTGTPRETEPLAITPDPEPTAKAPEFTPDALIDIIEKMTALNIQDGSLLGGWHCEDAIFKVTRINLRIDVSAPILRTMLFDLVEKGTLEHKRAYGLNKISVVSCAVKCATVLANRGGRYPTGGCRKCVVNT